MVVARAGAGYKKTPAGRFFYKLIYGFKGLKLSSHENSNESQHENQDSAAHGQNDGHQRDDGLNHIGGFSVV